MSPEEEGGVGTITKKKAKTDKPKLIKVILLNDDYTPMDFVVSVLEGIFKKTPSEAVQVMLRVHREGSALCGVFARDIAETKVMLTHQKAKSSGHPLRAIMEPNE